jgi:hypothetical protein
MNWSHCIETIDRELASQWAATERKITREVAQGVKCNPHGLILDEKRYRKQTDVAIKFWVSKGKWPLNPELANTVHSRFQFASKFLHNLSPLCLTSELTEKKFLRWLLVDYWRLHGRIEWIQHMEHLCGIGWRV